MGFVIVKARATSRHRRHFSRRGCNVCQPSGRGAGTKRSQPYQCRETAHRNSGASPAGRWSIISAGDPAMPPRRRAASCRRLADVIAHHGSFSVDGARHNQRFAEAMAAKPRRLRGGRRMRTVLKASKWLGGLAVLSLAALLAWLYLAPPDLIRVGSGYAA